MSGKESVVNLGFEFVGAKAKVDPDTAPTRQRMAPTEKTTRRNPDTDSKKIRHQQARRQATKESTMTTEADLIAKMASATTLDEQRGYAAELAALREAKVAKIRSDSSLDLAAEVVSSRYPTVSTVAFTQHSVASDWIGEIEPDNHDARQVEATMRSEATVWFNSRPDFVKADTTELRIQAIGVAGRLASQYGVNGPEAAQAFMGTVVHLHHNAMDEVQKPPYQPQEGSSLPTGVDNEDTFDNSISTPPDPKSNTNTGQVPSLGEGSSSDGDTSASVDNPAAAKTYDNSGGNAATVDYLDGTQYPWVDGGPSDDSFSDKGPPAAPKQSAWKPVPEKKTKTTCSCGFSTTDTKKWQKHIFAGDDTNRFREGHERVSRKVAAMPNIDDILAWENGEMAPEDEITFFQGLIDSGLAWSLQGMYGRQAAAMIEAGVCHAATTANRHTAEDTNLGWNDDDCPKCGAGVNKAKCKYCGTDTSKQLKMKGQRHTADESSSVNPKSDQPSLADGDSPAGDTAQSPTQPPVGNEDHSSGDGSTEDYIDGTNYPNGGYNFDVGTSTDAARHEGYGATKMQCGRCQNKWTTRAQYNLACPKCGAESNVSKQSSDAKPKGSPGPFPNSPGNTNGTETEESSGSVTYDADGKRTERQSSLDPYEAAKAVAWHTAGDVPEAFKKQWDKGGDSDDDKGSDDDGPPDFIKKKIEDKKSRKFLASDDDSDDDDDSDGEETDEDDDDGSDDSDGASDDDSDGEDGNTKQSRRRVTADDDSSGTTCSQCGDSIEKDPSSEDPSTWHHDNGEKHDHEAKPGGGDDSKTSVLRINPAFAARVQSSLHVANIPSYMNQLDPSEQYEEGYTDGRDAPSSYQDGFDDGSEGKPRTHTHDWHA